MAKKYTVATAPRRVRLKWLKKAQKMRKYYARCRAKLGIVGSRRSSSRAAVTPSSAPSAPPSLVGAGPLGQGGAISGAPSLTAPASPVRGLLGWSGYPEAGPYGGRSPSTNPWYVRKPYLGPRSVEEMWGPYEEREEAVSALHRRRNPGHTVRAGDRVSFADRFGKVRTGRAVMPSSDGGWVLNMGGKYGTPAVVHEQDIIRVGARKQTSRNPELLVVTNPGRRRSLRRYGLHRPAQMSVHGHIGRNAMRRRRRSRRRNLPLTVRIGGRKHTWRALVKKYGVKGAKKKWRGKKRYHGYTRTRVHNRRRRRRRNSWKGHRAAHRRAARKGHRRRRGARGRRRKYSRRRKGARGRRRKSSRRARKGWVKYGGRYHSQKSLRRKIGKRRLCNLLKRRGRRKRCKR